MYSSSFSPTVQQRLRFRSSSTSSLAWDSCCGQKSHSLTTRKNQFVDQLTVSSQSTSTMSYDGDGIFSRRFISQLLATEVVNILKILDGMHRGYLIHMLISHYTNIKTEPGQIQATEEILWISPVFSLLAIPMFGSLFIDRFGRKLSFVVVYISSLLAWIFTLNSVDIFHLYLGMGFAGLARGGSSLVVPIFVAEISNPR